MAITVTVQIPPMLPTTHERNVTRCATAALLMFLAVPGLAQQDQSLAKEAKNPFANLIDLQFYNDVTLGVGPVFQIPSAANDALGQGKWGAGQPAGIDRLDDCRGIRRARPDVPRSDPTRESPGFQRRTHLIGEGRILRCVADEYAPRPDRRGIRRRRHALARLGAAHAEALSGSARAVRSCASLRNNGVMVSPWAKIEKATTKKDTVTISSRSGKSGGKPSANARARAPRRPPQKSTCWCRRSTLSPLPPNSAQIG